ncbi:phage adaptor protein [Mesorhizobium sp. URHB0026]
MTTLADLTSAIADDIDDTTNEYGAGILKAVQAAQRYCERTTYYFNETRDVTFVTVNGQQWYTSAANANIPTLIRIEAVYSEDSNGQRLKLERSTPKELELLADNNAATGQPFWWTYFNQQIRLYPVPGAQVYTIRLQLGLYRLAPLVSSADTNAWLTEAFDLIKARAKYILCKDTLKDPGPAAEALNDWRDQDEALAAETASRAGRGKIQPTSF